MLNKKTISAAITCLCMCTLALFVGSCSEPVGGLGKSPVYLTAKGQSNWGLVVDVYSPGTPGGAGSDETFFITITSNYKNPNLTTPFADVTLQEYRVTYYRVDGKTSVPAPFTVQFTGVVPGGGTYDHETIVLRRDAKLRTPLKELVFGGGEGYIDLNAIIDFYGEDMMGNKVEVRYVLFLNVSDLS